MRRRRASPHRRRASPHRRRASPRGRPTEPTHWATPWRGARVLVEHGDPGVRDALVRGLRGRGYDVVGCPGPLTDDAGQVPGREGRACPLLEGRPCPAVDGADVVVTGLADSPTGRHIIEEIHRRASTCVLVIEGTPWMLRDLDAELADCGVWPLTPSELAIRLPPPRADAGG